MKNPTKETDVARGVVEWLHSYRWDVYQEVEAHGGVADIVAVQNKIVWVIETKTQLGLRVMEQAQGWVGYGNYVSVATPYSRNKFASDVMGHFGIGWMYMTTEYGYDTTTDRQAREIKTFHEALRPKLYRHKSPFLRILRPEHKTWGEAGNASSERYTPFRATCLAVLGAVRASTGGLTPRELVGKIQHHYRTPSTARSCLVAWAASGAIKGVTLERQGRDVRFVASR